MLKTITAKNAAPIARARAAAALLSPRIEFCRLGFFALLFLCAAAAQIAVFSESAAQTVTLDYAENDPRYNTIEPCETLGGTVQIAANGQSVCSEIDANDTFCIVGSNDAFPCRGLYKHVVLCNKEHNRVALNPFFCGAKCPSDESKVALGTSCADRLVFECDFLNIDDLLAAADENHEDCAELLIEGGANVNVKDDMGFTPLHKAATLNFSTIASLLIANGATINAKNNNGETPLHVAVMADSPAVASLLIANSADVDARDNDEWTPLHYAALINSPEIVILLIRSGADPDLETDVGLTPVDLASTRSHAVVRDILVRNGGLCNLTCGAPAN